VWQPGTRWTSAKPATTTGTAAATTIASAASTTQIWD